MTSTRLSLEGLQKLVGAWLESQPDGTWSPLANLARLTEEVGEVARDINVLFGPKQVKRGERAPDHEHLGDELADVILAAVLVAASTGTDLQAAVERALERLAARAAAEHEH